MQSFRRFLGSSWSQSAAPKIFRYLRNVCFILAALLPALLPLVCRQSRPLVQRTYWKMNIERGHLFKYFNETLTRDVAASIDERVPQSHMVSPVYGTLFREMGSPARGLKIWGRSFNIYWGNCIPGGAGKNAHEEKTGTVRHKRHGQDIRANMQ